MYFLKHETKVSHQSLQITTLLEPIIQLYPVLLPPNKSCWMHSGALSHTLVDQPWSTFCEFLRTKPSSVFMSFFPHFPDMLKQLM